MLQAFALKEKLKKNDYDIKVLDYRNKIVENDTKIITFWSKKCTVKQNIKNILSSTFFACKNYKRKLEFDKFRKNYLQLTEAYYDYQIKEGKIEKADIYICGSDQIWNTMITKELDDIYTLNFKTEAKKISYAPSIGNNNLLEDKKEEYTNKLRGIDNISVRESASKGLLEKILKRDVKIVLDPVFLLTANEWDEYLVDKYKFNKEYIFAYYLQKNELYNNLLKEVSKKNNLKMINFERRKKENNVLLNCYTAGPLDFVSLIKNSKIVVTSSFHAVVFSIIFHKNFFVVPHSETGSRVISLLEQLNLTDRIIKNDEQLKNIDYSKEIDWKNIDEKLDILRKDSFKWLIEAIEG